jgi:hypothetical protein
MHPAQPRKLHKRWSPSRYRRRLKRQDLRAPARSRWEADELLRATERTKTSWREKILAAAKSVRESGVKMLVALTSRKDRAVSAPKATCPRCTGRLRSASYEIPTWSCDSCGRMWRLFNGELGRFEPWR